MASLSFKKKLGFLFFFSSVSLIPLSHGAASIGDELPPSQTLAPRLPNNPEEPEVTVHPGSALKASSSTDIAKGFLDNIGSSVKKSFLELIKNLAEDVEDGLQDALELLTRKFTTWVHGLDGPTEKSVRLGCLPPKEGTLKALFNTSQVKLHQRKENIQFPARHILGGIPPCGDQGDLGACTGWALKKAIQCAESLDPNKPDAEKAAISALFMYYVERALEGTTDQDAGASLASGLLALKTIGVADESKWPYEPSAFKQPPSSDAYAQAQENMLLSSLDIASIDPSDPENFKAALVENKPVVFGTQIFENFMNIGKDGRVSLPKGRKIGGHALGMFGYDDNIEFEDGNKGAFLVQNHWSEGWGYSGPEGSGFCWIPYNLSYMLFDVWAIGKIGHGQTVPSYSAKSSLSSFLKDLKAHGASEPAAAPSEATVSAAAIANLVSSDSAPNDSSATSSLSRQKSIRTKVREAIDASEEDARAAEKLSLQAKQRTEELRAIQAELQTIKNTSSTTPVPSVSTDDAADAPVPTPVSPTIPAAGVEADGQLDGPSDDVATVLYTGIDQGDDEVDGAPSTPVDKVEPVAPAADATTDITPADSQTDVPADEDAAPSDASAPVASTDSTETDVPADQDASPSDAPAPVDSTDSTETDVPADQDAAPSDAPAPVDSTDTTAADQGDAPVDATPTEDASAPVDSTDTTAADQGDASTEAAPSTPVDPSAPADPVTDTTTNDTAANDDTTAPEADTSPATPPPVDKTRAAIASIIRRVKESGVDPSTLFQEVQEEMNAEKSTNGATPYQPASPLPVDAEILPIQVGSITPENSAIAGGQSSSQDSAPVSAEALPAAEDTSVAPSQPADTSATESHDIVPTDAALSDKPETFVQKVEAATAAVEQKVDTAIQKAEVAIAVPVTASTGVQLASATAVAPSLEKPQLSSKGTLGVVGATPAPKVTAAPAVRTPAAAKVSSAASGAPSPHRTAPTISAATPKTTAPAGAPTVKPLSTASVATKPSASTAGAPTTKTSTPASTSALGASQKSMPKEDPFD